MILTSNDIKQGEVLSEIHQGNYDGCTGQNLSPELIWKEVPAGTKSFAATAFDPDVNTECGWWHWLIYNIPADVRSLPRGAGNADLNLAPEGSVQGLSDLAEHGFHGACPAEGSGEHNYKFTVYALDVEELELPEEGIIMPAEVSYMINHHLIEKATIITPFQR